MSIAGGGWSLVYRYTFTNYGSFISSDNAVRPVPNYKLNFTCAETIPVSTDPPLVNNNQYGAVNTSLWSDLSPNNEFMVKSNINNGIKCKPLSNGPSFAKMAFGNFNCTKIETVATQCSNKEYGTMEFSSE